MTVRRIRPTESLQLREIRLAALADTPSAFSSKHATESELPIGHWVDRAAACADGARSATFVAVDSGRWVGLVGGFRGTEDDVNLELVSMWVAPAARGSGGAQALLQAVVGWATEISAEQIELWVMADNEPATRLYARAGFEPYVGFEPSPTDPCKDETRMCLRL